MPALRTGPAYAAVLAVAALSAAGLTQPAPAPAAAVDAATPGDRPAVVEVRTIGHSVKGRPIRAWRLGEPGKRRMVLVSTMHGNEPHTRAILESLRDGRAIRGIDLWVIPTYNPDGQTDLALAIHPGQVVADKLVQDGVPNEARINASLSDQYDRPMMLVPATTTSVVTSAYGLGDEALGAMGVLGPTRMDYPGAMASVRAVAMYLSKILDQG